MKSLNKSIKLISFALLVLLLSNCTEDFEETSFEINPKIDVTKAIVDGTVVSLNFNSNSNGTNQESPIPFANIKVFAEDLLIAESTADEDGRYSFDFPLDVGMERKLFIETSKPTFLPNVETLDLNESTNQKKFLFKSDGEELELGYSKDEVTITGRIDYREDFSLAVTHTRLNDSGERIGGWGRYRFFTGTNGAFSVSIPRNEEVTLRFFNPYGCNNNEQSAQIPESFNDDTDLGLITNITIPSNLQIDIVDLIAPDCMSGGELYINNDPIDLSNTPNYRLCSNVDEVVAFMINYDEKIISDKIYPNLSEELSLKFSECHSYEHSFSLKSSIGNYTEESEGIQIFEHRYRSDINTEFPGWNFINPTYKLEINIEDRYLFQVRGSASNIRESYVIAQFTDLNQEYDGLRIEGDSPKSFEIKDGFLTGAFKATQQWDGGGSIDFEIDIRVPIID